MSEAHYRIAQAHWRYEVTETATLPEAARLAITLLRHWTQARLLLANPLPAMHECVAAAGASPELAWACESCFALTEACLGRPLDAAEAGAGDRLTQDEQALLLMLAHACAPENGAIPHGLPGALNWASYAVARALAAMGQGDETRSLAVAPARCPFEGVTAWAA